MRHRISLGSALCTLLLAAACGSDVTLEASAGGVDGSTTTVASTSDDDAIPVEPDGGIGSTGLGGVPFFGGNDDQCPSTTLANEDDDQTLITEGADCFVAQVEAGQEVVWDLNRPTTDGDPTFTRHIFDGEHVWILVDPRADAFGNDPISQQQCAGIEASDWEPVGIDCVDAEFPGFMGFPEAELGG